LLPRISICQSSILYAHDTSNATKQHSERQRNEVLFGMFYTELYEQKLLQDIDKYIAYWVRYPYADLRHLRLMAFCHFIFIIQ
jgi:hypothetical protein